MANTLIKRAYEDDSLTEGQAKELLKCAKDPMYFMQNYIIVQHPTKGSVPFVLYDYQKRVLNNVENNNKNIILQPRQSGKTILITAYLLWEAIFKENYKIGVAAHKASGAKEIIARFKYAYEFLPHWLKPGVKVYNVFDIEFDNGSSIISQATTENTFRGMSMSCIYLDEMAFIPPRIADAFWTSLLPSMSAGGGNGVKLIATSTPNGSEGLFANLWFKAENDESDFCPTRVFNEEVPERDDVFKKKMLQSMSVTQYAQEFDCAFHSNKGTLIHSSVLESLRASTPIRTVLGMDFYKNPKGRRLGVVVDVAEGIGDGGDYTVVECFDVDTLEQIAEFRTNVMTISMFTKHFVKILTELDLQGAKEIYYTVESNPIGLSVINLLENATYSILDKVDMISDYKGKRKGMLTTSKSKLAGCTLLKDFLEEGRMEIHSKYLITELKFFVKKGMSFAAETGMHDDLVMSAVIFCNMIRELTRYDEDISNNINKIQTIDCISDDEPLPFVI